MTEDEWNACADPPPMIQFAIGRASDRRLRLFAVACCRRIWHILSDQRLRDGVELAEHYADDPKSPETLTRTAAEIGDMAHDFFLRGARPGEGPQMRENFHLQNAAISVAEALMEKVDWNFELYEPGSSAVGLSTEERDWEKVRDQDLKFQADVVRDIFGPSLFRTITPDAAWRTWNGGTVPRLARAVYDERELPSGRFDAGRLAVLADALEDAGCSDATVLDHLRQPGEHVRGCWVVDLLLGKT